MNLVIATLAMVTLLLSSVPASSASLCELSTVKLSVSKQMSGSWKVVNPQDNDGVVKLMRSAVIQAQTSNVAAVPLTEHRDVIEAYSQVSDRVASPLTFSCRLLLQRV